MFHKRAIQYLPNELKAESEAVALHRTLSKLSVYTKFTIAQLMRWNADKYSKHLTEQIENQRIIIERQEREIKALRASVYQSTINY